MIVNTEKELSEKQEKVEREMTFEEAEDIFFAEIEKGKMSGGKIPYEEFWEKFGFKEEK